MFRVAVVGLILGLLLWGLSPRPIFAPDWRTPLSVAVAADDCTSVERIVEILQITGHEDAYHDAVVTLGEAKKCRFASLDDEAISSSKRLVEQFGADNGILFRAYTRSPTIVRLRSLQLSRTATQNSLFDEAERRIRSAVRECRDKFSPIEGGIGNERLLAHALENPDVPARSIWHIADEQRARCAREFASAALVMEAAAQTRADRQRVSNFMPLLEIYGDNAPELAASLDRLQKRLAEFPPQGFVDESEGPGCFPAGADAADLWSAIRCAKSNGGSVEEDAIAVYFAARARRLGWRDVNAEEKSARERLSPECADAMIAVEAEAAGGSDDPRKFQLRNWPIDPGELCDPGQN